MDFFQTLSSFMMLSVWHYIAIPVASMYKALEDVMDTVKIMPSFWFD